MATPTSGASVPTLSAGRASMRPPRTTIRATRRPSARAAARGNPFARCRRSSRPDNPAPARPRRSPANGADEAPRHRRDGRDDREARRKVAFNPLNGVNNPRRVEDAEHVENAAGSGVAGERGDPKANAGEAKQRHRHQAFRRCGEEFVKRPSGSTESHLRPRQLGRRSGLLEHDPRGRDRIVTASGATLLGACATRGNSQRRRHLRLKVGSAR